MMANMRMHALMVLLLAGFSAAAQASVTLELRSIDAQGFVLAQDDATTSLQMVAPGVLHVHYAPMGRTTPPSPVIDPQPALAADFKPRISRRGDAVTLRSRHMVASWDPKNGMLTVSDLHGRTLLRQADLMALSEQRIVLEHAPGDALYGVGGFEANKPVTAGLLRSGKWVAQAGKQGHAGAPFVWSTAGYGVLVDCGGADFDLAGGHLTVTGFHRPDADYYILVGTPAELFGELAKLSGPAPMFPKWAMGFTNSQWGIDEKELLDIVNTYRARHIPIDNFTLDFDWKAWGQGDYGEFRWNPVKFPDGPSGKLARILGAEGMHITGIMKPRIHVDTVRRALCQRARSVDFRREGMPGLLLAQAGQAPRLRQAGSAALVRPSRDRVRLRPRHIRLVERRGRRGRFGHPVPEHGACVVRRPACGQRQARVVDQPQLLAGRAALRLRPVVGRHRYRIPEHGRAALAHAQLDRRGRDEMGHGRWRVQRPSVRPELCALDRVRSVHADLPRARDRKRKAPTVALRPGGRSGGHLRDPPALRTDSIHLFVPACGLRARRGTGPSA